MFDERIPGAAKPVVAEPAGPVLVSFSRSFSLGSTLFFGKKSPLPVPMSQEGGESLERCVATSVLEQDGRGG